MQNSDWIINEYIVQSTLDLRNPISPLLYRELFDLTYGLGEKEARRPTPKWNTRFYLAFSIRA